MDVLFKMGQHDDISEASLSPGSIFFSSDTDVIRWDTLTKSNYISGKKLIYSYVGDGSTANQTITGLSDLSGYSFLTISARCDIDSSAKDFVIPIAEGEITDEHPAIANLVTVAMDSDFNPLLVQTELEIYENKIVPIAKVTTALPNGTGVSRVGNDEGGYTLGISQIDDIATNHWFIYKIYGETRLGS